MSRCALESRKAINANLLTVAMDSTVTAANDNSKRVLEEFIC